MVQQPGGATAYCPSTFTARRTLTIVATQHEDLCAQQSSTLLVAGQRLPAVILPEANIGATWW